MKIAVTGATGQLGRIVVAQLKQKVAAEDIVAVVRSPEKAGDLGVEVRQAAYDNKPALEAALAGVDVVLLISSSEVGQRVSQHQNVIDAASKAGVDRLVYTSILRADISEITLAAEHKQTEDYLKNSGLDYTILRNGFYTENYMMGVEPALEFGAVVGSGGDARFATATRANFAEAAVAALLGAGHEGKTYELAGSDVFTYADLAAELTHQTGKKIVYNNLDTEAHVQVLENAGMPTSVAQMFAGFDSAASRGALDGRDDDFVALIGHKTDLLEDVLAATLKG